MKLYLKTYLRKKITILLSIYIWFHQRKKKEKKIYIIRNYHFRNIEESLFFFFLEILHFTEVEWITISELREKFALSAISDQIKYSFFVLFLSEQKLQRNVLGQKYPYSKHISFISFLFPNASKIENQNFPKSILYVILKLKKKLKKLSFLSLLIRTIDKNIEQNKTKIRK